MLYPGLYEQVINNALNRELADIPEARKSTAPIDTAEAAKVLAQYLTDVVQKGLENVQDNGGGIEAQIQLANQIVTTIQNTTQEADFAALSVDQRAEQLLALLQQNDPRLATGKSAKDLDRPETSIAQSSLFTGAIHEPQMYTELKKEIVSADRIDMLVSFIKWSGLRLIMDELRQFAQNGGELRIITTSYMGATDVKAIEELRALPNTKIKVSYDTKRTRLHAKTYVFYRDTGFTTAYVGSSNLSNAAISSGLEWNVKVTRKDLPETIEKIAATFESYWNSSEFEYYDEGQRERLTRALKAEKYSETDHSGIYTLDILPYSYQQEILDRLDAERTVRGYNRNLVVAATGTGKTVISALDYKRFCKQHPGQPCRLLFVAHREEILKQSLYTFRAVLKDANFGELYVGSHKADSIDHLFVSIQTFNSQELAAKTAADFYDYIVVDEFHHAAAPTYQKLLEYYQPKILLGLTATPERMDGKSVLDYFGGRIAAEIRLPEAIDRKLLCPFQYFGVTDTADLSSLKWRTGGYDKNELSNLYTLSGMVAERRADLVVNSILKYVTDIDEVKGLGFCVSIAHAQFMARYFNTHGIPSMALTGDSPDEERNAAKQRLVSGELRFLFVVDIYNEGVDIPEVNTVLFLRPTESLTVFLQQLPAALPAALRAVHTPLQDWLEQNPDDPVHAQLLELYFALQDIARAADRYDSHFVTQLTARGSELELHLLCLDPAPFVDASLAAGRSAALFSATLTPPAFYRSVLGCADARAVALPSPFPPENLGLFCLPGISTRYRQREASVPAVADALAALAKGKTGNYLAFFPSYAYLQQVYEAFAARWPDIPTLVQQRSLDDAGRAEFLAQFAPHPANTLLGFAVMGGIFGEGVDLVGDRLIGCAIVGVGLPQVNPRQEMLRRYYEEQSGCGFDYAYRYPGMNKVLQAAGRVVRTPQDKGVVLLLDDRFAQPDTARLFPPHWQHIQYLPGTAALETALKGFWDV